MLKWKKVVPIYPTDHIISSKARELGTWGFTPQYEKEHNDNMKFIMSNEYMRLWFKERELYQKENYAKEENTYNDSKLKRRFVQRMVIFPKLKQKELPVIHLKKFQNVISKIDNRKTDEEKIKACKKCKKAIKPTIIMERFKTNMAKTPNLNVKDETQRNAPSETNNSTKMSTNKTLKTNCALVMKLK